MQTDYSSLLFMLVLIAVGFTARKVKLLQAAHIDAMPAILLNIAYPSLIICSVTSVEIKNLAKESIIVVIATFAITLLLFFGGLAVLKRYNNKERKPIMLFALAIGNITYVALPVVRAVFGDTGVYYAILHGSAQDILIWTLYYAYFVGGGSLSGITVKKLFSPSFIAIIAAVVLALLGIRPQGVISDLLQALAGLTVPLALVYVGGMLAGHGRLKDWIPNRDTVVISLVKVLGVPLIVFGIMQFVPVGYEIKLLMAVVFSAPATILSTIWAKQYGYDEAFAIKTLLFSTLVFLAASCLLFVFINTGNT